MALRDLEERLCRTGRLSATLLPLLEGALGYSERSRKLRLRKAALHTHATDVRRRLDLNTPTTTCFDFPNTFDHFLPHVTVGLGLRQCLASEFLSHFEMPPMVSSRCARSRRRVWPWNRASASRTRLARIAENE